MTFRIICDTADLPAPGSMRELTIGARQLCIANDGGRYAAVDNICPHRGAPLAEGTLEDGKVICPWHAWAFDLKTGEADHDPANAVGVYLLRVEGDAVMADLDDR